MFEFLVFVLAIGTGVAVGRWWALLAAVPFGTWAAWEVPLENTEPPHWELGLVAGLFVALGLALGVGVRAASRRQGSAH